MAVTAGSIRFNTDSSKMEIYNGEKWWEIDSTSPYEQTGGTGGVWAGGNNQTYYSERMVANLTTTGNASDFGHLIRDKNSAYGSASRTRGITFGGYDGSSRLAEIDYFDMGTDATAADFGDLNNPTSAVNPSGNQTRMIAAGGYAPSCLAVIDYITIAATVSAKDFGDLTYGSKASSSHYNSSTRGIMAGGGCPSATHNMQYLTFATQGNTAAFGDCTTSTTGADGMGGNAIRGIGWKASDIIEYVTIATI